MRRSCRGCCCSVLAGAQINIPLASDGVLRYVWESRYGSILVEVQGNAIFVNGQRVEP